MVLQLSVATADDAEEIASIHLATFDGNVLLHAQFPTEVSRASLHDCLKQDVIETVKTGNPDKIDLVVRDTEIDQIISFAKYDLPSISVIDDDHAFSELWPPKESRQDLLEKYSTTAEAAKRRVLGVNPCYRKLCLILPSPSLRSLPSDFIRVAADLSPHSPTIDD
jgi:hypothetical protein